MNIQCVDEILTEMMSIPNVCVEHVRVNDGFIVLEYNVKTNSFRWSLEAIVKFMEEHSAVLDNISIRTREESFRVYCFFGILQRPSRKREES